MTQEICPTAINTPVSLRRHEAARYVRERYGVPCSTQWLAKLVTVGGGPLYRKAGKYPIYTVEDLDTWILSRVTDPLASSSHVALT